MKNYKMRLFLFTEKNLSFYLIKAISDPHMSPNQKTTALFDNQASDVCKAQNDV